MIRPALFFHVAAMGDEWKLLLDNQLSYLRATCGTHIDTYLCLAGTDASSIESEVYNHTPELAIHIPADNLDLNQYEFPTLSLLRYHALSNPDSIIGYAHTKGVSNYPFSTKNIQWREYLQWACWERFDQCMSALDNGSDAVGVELISPHWFPVEHYSGNFWWAKASYLSTLPDISTWRHRRWRRKTSLSQKNERWHIRFNAEFWIGIGNGKLANINSAPRQRFRKAAWPRSAYTRAPHPINQITHL